MTPWSATKIIAQREIRSRVFSRPFLVGLLTTVGLIFGGFGLASVINSDDPVRIGLVGDQPANATLALEAIADLDETEIELETFADRATAEQAVLDGEVDGAVIDDEIVMTEVDSQVVALVTPAWQQADLVSELGTAGLEPSAIDRAFAQAVPLEIVELEPQDDSEARQAVAFFSVILLFIAIQVAGAFIMMGVFEEKSTKVVELVLSSIPARYLLAGKVIGIGLLGLIQVAALAGSAIAAASIFGSSALPAISPALIGFGLIWFILGYLLYGSIFAAGASLAPRQEDAQATLAPVSIILMLSYFGAIFTAAEPDGIAARIVSWLPFTAPFAMPGRIAAGDALWWEVVGSMAVTAACAGAVLLLAERIYVRSIIHTDRKLGWREAWSMSS